MSEPMFRDHSKPCEHGHSGPHGQQLTSRPAIGLELIPVCPGGREVTIDYRAAYETAWAIGLRNLLPELDDDEVTEQLAMLVDVAVYGSYSAERVDAALGGSDE